MLFFGFLLMIVIRQKYPRWWFDWNLELQRFSDKVGAYLALMREPIQQCPPQRWHPTSGVLDREKGVEPAQG